jgi:hypothetical protein
VFSIGSDSLHLDSERFGLDRIGAAKSVQVQGELCPIRSGHRIRFEPERGRPRFREHVAERVDGFGSCSTRSNPLRCESPRTSGTAARMARGGRVGSGFSSAQRIGGRVPAVKGTSTLWGSCLMSESNSKRTAPVHDGFVWAGTVARMRRGGKSSRAGRRSALLGVLTSVYANSSRGGRSTDSRSSSDRT